eukprot:8324201-Pyramimonas_sp.AAC.1
MVDMLITLSEVPQHSKSSTTMMISQTCLHAGSPDAVRGAPIRCHIKIRVVTQLPFPRGRMLAQNLAVKPLKALEKTMGRRPPVGSANS